jgi:hypothetical protein
MWKPLASQKAKFRGRLPAKPSSAEEGVIAAMNDSSSIPFSEYVSNILDVSSPNTDAHHKMPLQIFAALFHNGSSRA